MIELLAVVVVMGIIASALAGSMHWMLAKQRAKQAAGEFQSLVREATALARREMVPVRLAFILPKSAEALKEAGVEEEGARPALGCRLLLFQIPARNLPVQALQAPAGDLVPAIPIGRLPRFQSLTGAWSAAPNRRGWLRWDDVEMEGDLAEAYSEQGFEAVVKKFQFQPKTFWSDRKGASSDPFSVYPEEFALSPYRDLRTIVNSAMPTGETVTLDGSGLLSAEDVFGEQELPHWSARGDTESKQDRVELAALDFLPDGSLACRDEVEELEFRFGDIGKKSHWIVKVRTADAEVWVE